MRILHCFAIKQITLSIFSTNLYLPAQSLFNQYTRKYEKQDFIKAL